MYKKNNPLSAEICISNKLVICNHMLIRTKKPHLPFPYQKALGQEMMYYITR
jgi:hypothetical protein